MDAERISYEVLQDLVRAERRSNRLSPVQARFWSELRAFLDDIKAVFREEQQRDPFSRRAMMARDEAQNALQAADSLWSLRERKMALYALAQPKEGKTERPEGLTAEEIDLYDRFVRTLREGKEEVFGETVRPVPAQPVPVPSTSAAPSPAAPVSAPAAPEEAPRPPPARPRHDEVPPDLHEPPAEAEEERPEEPAPAPRPEPRTIPADTPTEELLTIRALGDIPPFVGPDMQTYLLREGDFAMVPPAIAKLLEKRGKAEVVETAAQRAS